MKIETKTSLIHRATWEGIVDRHDNEMIVTPNWLQVTTPKQKSAHMNGVYRCERDDLNDLQVRKLVFDIIDYYKSQNSNFRWKTSSSTRPIGLNKILIEHGMILKDLLFGFCVSPEEMNPLKTSDKIEVFPLTVDRYEDWLQIQAKGWNVTPNGIKYLREHPNEFIDQTSKNKNFIAYWDGVPAGVPSFQIKNDYAYMLGAVVISEYRGHGLYKALIDSRFQALKSLGLPAVFHCISNTSAPICLKLGFEKICEIESYELPG